MDVMMLGAVELSAKIAAREISCRELMIATLDRIARINPTINAIINLRERAELLAEADACDVELARGQSRGWMHGMPQAVKDLAATKGLVTTLGSPAFKNNVPLEDSIHVARVREAGAIIIGKTNTPEFGLGSHTYNTLFGATGNAYDPTKSAGGSSGGAAAALAARLLPVADGSDMMGSLRNPAAFNNIIGFRPSYGRVPAAPAPEIFMHDLATNGPMGRCVADVAALLATQAGYDPRSPHSLAGDGSEFRNITASDPKGLRIGWLGDLGGHLPFEAGILDLCRDALGSFADLGCDIEDASTGFDMERLWRAWITLRGATVAHDLRALYKDRAKRDMLKPEAIWEIENGLKLSAADLFEASETRSAWYRAVSKLFDRYDFLVLPAAQVFPFDIAETWPRAIAGKTMDTYHRWMEVVVPVSILGLPTLALPAGFGDGGLPMGIQLIGRPRDDGAVLSLGAAYEAVTDWANRLPSIAKA